MTRIWPEITYFHPFVAEWIRSQGWTYEYEVTLPHYSLPRRSFKIDYVVHDTKDSVILLECKKTLLQGQNVPRTMAKMEDYLKSYEALHGKQRNIHAGLAVPAGLYTSTQERWADEYDVMIYPLVCPPELIAKMGVMTQEQFLNRRERYNAYRRQLNAEIKRQIEQSNNSLS